MNKAFAVKMFRILLHVSELCRTCGHEDRLMIIHSENGNKLKRTKEYYASPPPVLLREMMHIKPNDDSIRMN